MFKGFRVIVLILLVTPAALFGQGAAASHVFPQIADGGSPDGTYVTSVIATNVSTQAATCTLKFYGVPASRLGSTPLTVTLPSQGSVFQWATGGNGDLTTGYATLSCDRQVTAGAVYLRLTPNTVVVNAGATVFSSPPSMRAQLFVQELGPTVQTAMAIANDTDAAATYQIAVTDAVTGAVRNATVNVPARSNLPRFVNQLVSLPSTFAGTVVITGTTPFSVVGLNFIWQTFISQPATLY